MQGMKAHSIFKANKKTSFLNTKKYIIFIQYLAYRSLKEFITAL